MVSPDPPIHAETASSTTSSRSATEKRKGSVGDAYRIETVRGPAQLWRLCRRRPDGRRALGDAHKLSGYGGASQVAVEPGAAPDAPKEVLESTSGLSMEDGFVGRVD